MRQLHNMYLLKLAGVADLPVPQLPVFIPPGRVHPSSLRQDHGVLLACRHLRDEITRVLQLHQARTRHLPGFLTQPETADTRLKPPERASLAPGEEISVLV